MDAYEQARPLFTIEKYASILSDLSGPEERQISALDDLLTLLTYGDQQSLSNSPIDLFCQGMVKSLYSDSENVCRVASACVYAILEAHTASTRCLMNAQCLPILAVHVLEPRFPDTAENCLKALEKISHYRASEVGQQIGLEPFLNHFDKFKLVFQRLSIHAIRIVTSSYVADEFAAFLPRLLDISENECERIQNDSISAIENIAANVPPGLVSSNVIGRMTRSLRFLNGLVHLSTVPEHISAILGTAFDFGAALNERRSADDTRLLLFLIRNLLPAPPVKLKYLEFPDHQRPQESNEFARTIQPDLMRLIVENPVHCHILLSNLIATIAVKPMPLTDEVLMVLKSAVSSDPDLSALVLAVLSFYPKEPMIAESGILSLLSGASMYGPAKTWFTRVLRSLVKSSAQAETDVLATASLHEIVSLIRSEQIRKIQFLTTGIARCLALLNERSLDHLSADESKFLADYCVSLLSLIVLPRAGTRDSLHSLIDWAKRPLHVLFSAPGATSPSFLAVPPLEPAATIEGWYNATSSFGAQKLIEAADDCPELGELIVPRGIQKLTTAHISIFFRALLGERYPHFHIVSNNVPYSISTPLLEVAKRCSPHFTPPRLEISLVPGDVPANPRLRPSEPYSDLKELLDLLAILAKSAPITPNPVFCQRIRANLAGTEGLVTRDSRALATVYSAPVLFNFSTRLLAFKLASYDLRAVIATVSKELNTEINASDLPVDHVKVYVHRDAIFTDGANILSHFAGTQSRLEISFVGEEGIGFGPTHEFFTLFSRELSRSDRQLFRTDDPNSFLANCKSGLFFSPMASPRGAELLGRFIAKALQMNCLVDLNLNPALFKFLRGHSVDVSEVDPMLAQSLASPAGMIGMPFVYPGLNIELIPGGSDVDITAETIADYVCQVSAWTGGEKLVPLRHAFIRGFEEVMPCWVLDVFSDMEICTLLRGEVVRFGVADLTENVVISHGFTSDAPEIRMLFEVLSEMSVEQQRLLVQFITGYSQLPIGGLAALEPKLTVARRPGDDADMQLPSVMTCKNYFKVPAYTSKEVMKERILTAITEGQGSFDLT
jgi:E3 ubiquitin-protein ligase TRIP12